MRLEHHLVGGYVRYISPHIIIIIIIIYSRYSASPLVRQKPNIFENARGPSLTAYC